MEDVGSYNCRDIEDTHNPGVAALTILDSRPLCWSNVKSDGLLGPNDCSIVPEVLNLSCSVIYHGNTPPTLQWISVKDHTPAITSGGNCSVYRNNTMNGGKVKCDMAVNAELNLHKSSLVCQTNSSATEQYRCSTDPINVLYTFSNFHGIEKTIDETVKCSANSTAQCKYKWLLNNTVIGDGSSVVTLRTPGLHRCEAMCNMRGSQCSVAAMLVHVNTAPEPETGTSTILAIVFGVLLVLCIVAWIICSLLYLRCSRSKRQRTNVLYGSISKENHELKIQMPNIPPTDEHNIIGRPLLNTEPEAKNNDFAIQNKKLEDTQRKLDVKQKELENIQEELEDSRRKLGEKNEELSTKNLEIENKNKQLKDKQKDLEDSRRKLGQKNEELANKNIEIENKNRELEKLREQTRDFRESIGRPQDEKNQLISRKKQPGVRLYARARGNSELPLKNKELEDSKGELKMKNEESSKPDADNVLIIGLSDGSSITREVLKINLQNPSESYRVEDVANDMNVEATAAVYHNTVYVVGLGNYPDKIWKYESKSGWIKCVSLTHGRTRHSVAFVDEVLYICGGFDEADENVLDSVEAYSTAGYRPMCNSVGKLASPVHSSGNCVAYKKSLYIFGGMDKNEKPISDVQVYDTLENSCHLLWSKLPDAQHLLRAALWRESVILLGKWNCFIYDFSTQIWHERVDFKTNVDHFGLALSNDRIYVIGGVCTTDAEGRHAWICRDDVRSVAIEEIIDGEAVEWKVHGRLPRPCSVSAFAVVNW